MCKCTPNIKTPFCGKPGCEWPKQREQVPSKDCDCCKDGFFPFCPCGCHQRAAAQRVAHAVSMEEKVERLERALRGIQSCSTCERCRGAATLALGGAAPEPKSEHGGGIMTLAECVEAEGGIPFVGMEANTDPLTHQEIFRAVHHHASEIVRLTAAVPAQCSPQPPGDGQP